MSSEKVKNNKYNSLKWLFALLLPLIIFGCIRDVRDDYRPQNNGYSSVPYVAPAPVPVRQQPYQGSYGNQNQPYYYGAPNSRQYYNPYDFQQPYGRNPYSDYDQYYVPPVQYYNNESPNYQQNNGNAGGFSGKS